MRTEYEYPQVFFKCLCDKEQQQKGFLQELHSAYAQLSNDYIDENKFIHCASLCIQLVYVDEIDVATILHFVKRKGLEL